MAKHLVKCPICGETFDANEEPFIKIKNRYAHENCYKAKEANKSEEEKEKELLYSYISRIYGSSANYALINRQMANYLKQGYTYRSIRKTLVYWFDIKHGDVEKTRGGVGIVPHIYQDALTYWRAIWEAQQKNQEVVASLPTVEVPVREIRIAPPQRKPSKRQRKLFTFLEEESEEV